MRKTLSLITVFFCLLVFSSLHAAVITVDNKVPSAGQYSTLQAAHDAASNGDTVYVYPSGVPYVAITVTKRLHFVGTGFDYPGEAMKTTLMTGTMTFSSGSDGSVLEGFGMSSAFNVYVAASKITIRRNKLKGLAISPHNVSTVILQNYFIGYISGQIIGVNDDNEVLVANNIIINTYNSGYTGTYYLGINTQQYSNITITILNNIFYMREDSGYALHLVTSNYHVANNIILTSRCDVSENCFNNMCDRTQLPAGNGNILNVDMNTVFVDFANGDFHLLPDSPARGAGMDGVDMGIYGGDSPFVDGGRPGLPSIIELKSSHIGSQQSGLDVTIKAQSNRE